MTATREQKVSDFESRQQLCAEEIEEFHQAIEVISIAVVSGNAEAFATIVAGKVIYGSVAC